jgi:hypothetical protein
VIGGCDCRDTGEGGCRSKRPAQTSTLYERHIHGFLAQSKTLKKDQNAPKKE